MKIVQKERDGSLCGRIIEEIKELLQGFVDVSVCAVRRTANGDAHVLAKEG
jgi:hypothetical protein